MADTFFDQRNIWSLTKFLIRFHVPKSLLLTVSSLLIGITQLIFLIMDRALLFKLEDRSIYFENYALQLVSLMAFSFHFALLGLGFAFVCGDRRTTLFAVFSLILNTSTIIGSLIFETNLLSYRVEAKHLSRPISFRPKFW